MIYISRCKHVWGQWSPIKDLPFFAWWKDGSFLGQVRFCNICNKAERRKVR